MAFPDRLVGKLRAQTRPRGQLHTVHGRRRTSHISVVIVIVIIIMICIINPHHHHHHHHAPPSSASSRNIVLIINQAKHAIQVSWACPTTPERQRNKQGTSETKNERHIKKERKKEHTILVQRKAVQEESTGIARF